MTTHDNADSVKLAGASVDQLVLENRILGQHVRRLAERCERLEQELLLERIQVAVRMRETLRDCVVPVTIKEEQ